MNATSEKCTVDIPERRCVHIWYTPAHQQETRFSTSPGGQLKVTGYRTQRVKRLITMLKGVFNNDFQFLTFLQVTGK